jgi:hypothetical protein
MVSAVCVAQVPGPPQMSVAPERFDLGPLRQGDRGTHTFRILNVGQSPLTILRVNAACGCTTSALGKAVLAPGEGTDLEVALNTAGLHGKVIKTVQLVSDEPNRPNRILTLEAEIAKEVVAETEEVFFLDLVRKDRKKASVKLASGTAEALHVADVELSEAPWLGVATREEGHDVFVDLELLARNLPAGKVSGTDTITLKVVNPGPSSQTLSVHWERRSAITVSPARVAWAEASGRELTTPIRLAHGEGKAFRVVSARTSDPLLSVRGVDETAASRHALQVVLSPEAKPGTFDAKVFVKVDLPGQPELEIRVAAVLR